MTTWLHTHLPRLSAGDANPISVKRPGQRIEYAAWVSMRNVEFRVNEAGRQRCLEYGVRNVHAWIVGTEILRCEAEFPGEFDKQPAGYRRAVYDPWKGSAFVDALTLTAVFEADLVIMSGKDVYYT
jgi:hypothetical protein